MAAIRYDTKRLSAHGFSRQPRFLRLLRVAVGGATGPAGSGRSRDAGARARPLGARVADMCGSRAVSGGEGRSGEAPGQGTVYFDDLTLGQRWRRGPAQVSAEGIVAFAREWDPQPFHVDAEAAARSRFGGLIASGAHTFALVARLFTTPLGIAFVAARGFEHVRLLRPLRPDTDVYLDIQVLRLKPGPYPDSGQVDFTLKLVDGCGHVIALAKAETLVAREPASRP
jgi:acyl dehydratase